MNTFPATASILSERELCQFIKDFIEADKKEYESKFKSFLDGYLQIRTLSDVELELIPEAGAAIFIFYLGVQAKRFDWSNIFYTENYLKMFVGKIKDWMDYYENKKLRVICDHVYCITFPLGSAQTGFDLIQSQKNSFSI